MFRNYLLVAIRSFLQQRFYSVLNIAGLALGLASIILVALWINDELNYDTHFVNSDKIYRIECSLITDGVPTPMIATDRRMAPILRKDYNNVCEATAIYKAPSLLSNGKKNYYEEEAFYADSAFFSVFPFEFVAGDPKNALTDSSAVVITEQVANKLFGHNHPIGDSIWFNNHQTKASMRPSVITAVIKENPKASHFHPAVIFAKRRNLDAFEPVYISFKNGYTPDYFIKHIWKPYYKNIIIPNYAYERQDLRLDRLQPITAIHLSGNNWEEFETNGDRSLLYIFGASGLLILLLACINYINLATARSFSRSREIAVRKVLGATRANIVAQFLVEAVVTVLVALLIAFSLVEITLPFFNDLAGKHIDLYDMGIGLLSGIVISAILTGLIAGAYPAFFISSFQPANAIKDIAGSSPGKACLRKSLIIFQFSISLIMLITTLEIWRQINYVKHYDLGFDSDNILVVALRDERVYAQSELVKETLEKNKNILHASIVHNVPGGGLNNTYINFEQPGGMKSLLISSMFVDHGFANLIGLHFTEGMNFTSLMNNEHDSSYVIINESAKRQLGYSNAVNKKIHGGRYYGNLQGRIVGVVKDFHATSLHTQLQPMAIVLGTLGRPEGKLKYLLVKMKPGNIPGTIDFIKKTYLSYGQEHSFHYTLLNEKFNAQYRKEEKQMILFNSFTIISLFTSLLGLIGLATFFMQQRTREICIRRISGASATEVFYILSKDYVPLILIAWLLACPVAFIASEQWLATFAYHVSFRPYAFLLSGLIVMILVLVAVLIQTRTAIQLKAADILRHQ